MDLEIYFEKGRWSSFAILSVILSKVRFYHSIKKNKLKKFLKHSRPVRSCNKDFPELDEEHVGALHDASSYMMLNENSIVELNSRLDNPIATAMHFRPNFVIKGPPAFAEDDFQWVRIGQDTIFKAVKPCTRCIFTTVDPETGVKDANGEPLKTLKTYRMFPGITNPVMGLHLGIIAHGNVKVGDTVYIGKS